MKKPVRDLDFFQKYLQGVMSRAMTQQPQVAGIALALASAVIWKKDGDILVWERDGRLVNVLQVQINGAEYTFAFRHAMPGHTIEKIEVKKGTTHGRVLRYFDNSNTVEDVLRFFESL